MWLQPFHPSSLKAPGDTSNQRLRQSPPAIVTIYYPPQGLCFQVSPERSKQMVSHGFYASLQVYSMLPTELLLMPTLSLRTSLFPPLIYSSPEARNEPALQADVSDWKTHLCNSTVPCYSHHLIPVSLSVLRLILTVGGICDFLLTNNMAKGMKCHFRDHVT